MDLLARFEAGPLGLRRILQVLCVCGLVTGMHGAALAEKVPEKVASPEKVAPPRERTLAILKSLEGEESGFSLRAWVNEGRGDGIPIGDDIRYHFLASRDSHLTALHVDSHGVATLLFPNDLDHGTKLLAGIDKQFPSTGSDLDVRAEPPVGTDFVLALATSAPIAPSELGVSLDSQAVAIVEAMQAPALAQRLKARYLAEAPGNRAVAQAVQRIVGRSESIEYSSVDVVSYFTTRTRSISRPRLDLHVHFASDSDQLDADGMSNLDEVARALEDRKMRDMRFRVSGHTDDVGDDLYNEDLSRRRAEEVMRYLAETNGIEPARLELSYYGERRPLDPGVSREARRLNRRVEFELIR